LADTNDDVTAGVKVQMSSYDNILALQPLLKLLPTTTLLSTVQRDAGIQCYVKIRHVSQSAAETHVANDVDECCYNGDCDDNEDGVDSSVRDRFTVSVLSLLRDNQATCLRQRPASS
jgi:hypothetical protein